KRSGGVARSEYLWSYYLQAIVEEGFDCGRITQRAPDHHVELTGYPVHQADRQRRLADAAHADHAHHSAALLHHPFGQQIQLPFSSKEGWHIECVSPTQARYPYPGSAQYRVCRRPLGTWYLVLGAQ